MVDENINLAELKKQMMERRRLQTIMMAVIYFFAGPIIAFIIMEFFKYIA